MFETFYGDLVFSADQVTSRKNGFPCFVYKIMSPKSSSLSLTIIIITMLIMVIMLILIIMMTMMIIMTKKLFIDVFQWWIKVENEETPDHPDISFSNFEQFYSSF